MTTLTFPGTFPDVTANGTTLYISCCANSQVVVGKLDTVTGVHEHFYSAFCDGSGFARIRFDGDQLHLIYRPNIGVDVVWMNLSLMQARHYAGVFYNSPVCLGAGRFAINNYADAGVARHAILRELQHERGLIPADNPDAVVAETEDLTPLVESRFALWEMAAPKTAGLYVYDYHGSAQDGQPLMAGTGIAFDDGAQFVSIDDARMREYDDVILNPQYASDGTFTGEDNSGSAGAGAVKAGKKIVLLAGQNTYVPKIVKYGDRYAVVTSDYQTCTLVYDITDADFGQVIPDPGPDPIPEPEPEPEPEPPSGYDPKPDLRAVSGMLTDATAALNAVIRKLH